MRAAAPPQVSCILAATGFSDPLVTTLESVLASRGITFECILILNGLPQSEYDIVVSELRSRFPLVRPFFLLERGLTQALIRGCAVARGRYLARIDSGDSMTPDRLRRQWQQLERDADCVLVTSDVEICGPCWEGLQVKRRFPAMKEALKATTCPPEQGLAIDIPHHASVMFRRSAYEAVGGYRPQFYFGQDWDLWYRLAQQGTFIHIPEVLTRVRLFPDALSSRHWREQRAIAALSLACYVARCRGRSEAPLLARAAAIRPSSAPAATRRFRLPFSRSRAEGNYFIAESLRRNRDRRCQPYFRAAIRAQPWRPRFWLRAFQSLGLPAAA